MLHFIRTILYEAVPDPAAGSGGGASQAGTEGGTGATAPPPAAEPSTPDREGSGPPETIPYHRFKEVNDELAELRDYKQFSELGYDPDSLGQLVQFDTAYGQDPLGTLGNVIDSLDMIPDNRKAALKELIAVTPESPTPGGDGTGDTSEDPPPKWAKPLLEDLDTRKQNAEREQAEAVSRQNDEDLDNILAHWQKLDKDAGIETDEETMLAYIQAAAGRPDIQSLEQLAEAARASRLRARERDLGGAVVRRTEGSPLAVPTRGAPATQPQRIKNIKDASRAALVDIQAGRLGGAE